MNVYIQNKSYDNIPFPNKQLFKQSHYVDLCAENRVLLYEKNWNLRVKVVP